MNSALGPLGPIDAAMHLYSLYMQFHFQTEVKQNCNKAAVFMKENLSYITEWMKLA